MKNEQNIASPLPLMEGSTVDAAVDAWMYVYMNLHRNRHAGRYHGRSIVRADVATPLLYIQCALKSGVGWGRIQVWSHWLSRAGTIEGARGGMKADAFSYLAVNSVALEKKTANMDLYKEIYLFMV